MGYSEIVEITVEPGGGFTIGCICLLGGGESAEKLYSSISAYCRFPLARPITVANPLKATGVVL
jgi:hypothetical protein